MHAMQGHAQTLAETARTMLRRGQRPVLVWLPLDKEGTMFAAYLCAQDDAYAIPTYRVVSSLGQTSGEDTDFAKGGLAWAAMEAGAGFRRFTRRTDADNSARACVILPNGIDIYIAG